MDSLHPTARQLAEKLEDCRAFLAVPPGRQLNIKLIRERSSVADGAAIYLIEDKLFLHLSPESFPRVALDEVIAMQNAKLRLGPDFGSVILDPISGDLNGRSFMALPKCRTISNNRFLAAWQRRLIRPRALLWLRGLVGLATPPSEYAKDAFGAALAELASSQAAIPDFIRSASLEAIGKIETKEVAPRFVPMHGDFWVGNILTSKDRPMVVIDWRGSRMDGFGIYDLIRLAASVGLSSHALSREISFHAETLGISKSHAKGYLLAAFGYYLLHLGEFPLERFLSMISTLYGVFESAIRDR